MDCSALMTMAAHTHGVFRHSDACSVGMDRNVLRTLRRTGVIELVGNDVYVVAGSPDSWSRRALAATWCTSGLALVSHRAAAALFGLCERRAVEVIAPMGRVGLSSSVRVHRTRFLPGEDMAEVEQIPVTSMERTVVDLASIYPMGKLARLLDEAIEKRLTTAERVHRRLLTMPTRGRYGVVYLRVLLQERLGFDPQDVNPFERRFAHMLRASRLPKPMRQHRVRDGDVNYYLDFAFPEYMVAVECDGMLGHASAAAQGYDLRRQNHLIEAGWVLRRFTFSDVALQPSQTMDTVRRALHANGWTPPQPAF